MAWRVASHPMQMTREMEGSKGATGREYRFGQVDQDPSRLFKPIRLSVPLSCMPKHVEPMLPCRAENHSHAGLQATGRMALLDQGPKRAGFIMGWARSCCLRQDPNPKMNQTKFDFKVFFYAYL